MRAPLEAALEAVALRLISAGVPFLLGGSALLDALGLDVEPRDVDLMLQPQDREAFEAACAPWLVAVTEEPGPVLTSEWKATLDVDGVEVDGLGGLGFAGGPPVPFRGGGSRMYGSAPVALCAPETWWALYRAYKPERATLLEPLVSEADRARILAELGYAAVAERYLDAVEATEHDPRLRFLGDLALRLHEGAEVLDLGCGAGRPNAALLARRFRVTGVDVSERQLELARAAAPTATFLRADIADVEFPDGSFDAAVALYSIAHLPRERHGPLYARIAAWLRPGGLLLAALACGDQPGVIEEDWLGAPMYFSSFDAATNRRLIEAAGFRVLHDELVTMREGGAVDATFQWVLALGPRPATVAAVCRAEAHALGKPAVERIRLLTGLGVEGDAHLGRTVQHRSRVARDPSRPNLRQVHLIHGELHDELRARGFDVGPGVMGENVTTRGVDLLALPAGTRLRLGAEAVVEVTGLRNPCAQLDGHQDGLMAAVLDRDADGALVRKAGIMAIVLAGGEVRAGDAIAVELPPPPHAPLEPV